MRTTLISSLRRSSVSAGIGTRITSPDVAGLRPRSESRIAFSITGIIFFSHGCTVIVRASASVTLAHLAERHRRAVVVDVDVIEQAGVRAAGADLAEVVLQRLDRLLPSSARRSS